MGNADIAVHHLHLRGNRQQCHYLSRELQSSDWSLVPVKDWVFVRNLHIRARASQLRRETGAELNRVVQQAVDGRGIVPANAAAVRFQSLPQLLVFLLRDLADAKPMAWYWQRWARYFNEHRANAVARVLWDHAEHLAAVLQQLHDHHCLANVWQQLTPRSAREISYRYGQITGTALTTHSDPTGPKLSKRQRQQLLTHVLHCNPPLLRTWSAVLRAIPSGDSRLRLAAAVVCTEHFPVIGQTHPAEFIQVFAQALESLSPQLGESQATFNRQGQQRSTLRHSPENPALAPERNVALVPENKNNKGNDSNDMPKTHSGDAAITAPLNVKEKTQPAVPLEMSDVMADAVQSNRQAAFDEGPVDTLAHPPAANFDTPVDDDLTKAIPVETLFHTYWGGFFYLINAVRTSAIKTLLQAALQAKREQPGVGWLRLFQLATLLNASLDPSLRRFIALNCGMASDADLDRQYRPSPLEQLHAQLQTEYREQGLWQSDLLRVPAQVTATPSHVDVYFPLNSVRLPVRCAGLDVNPGWVGWLGRVVTFHYVESGPVNFDRVTP